MALDDSGYTSIVSPGSVGTKNHDGLITAGEDNETEEGEIQEREDHLIF